MIITVQFGQSLMDIAIQRYGSASALIDLANDNGLAPDADVYAGDQLKIRETPPETTIVVFRDYLGENEIVVISGQGGETENVELLGTNDDNEVLGDNNDNGFEA